MKKIFMISIALFMAGCGPRVEPSCKTYLVQREPTRVFVKMWMTVDKEIVTCLEYKPVKS